MSDPYLPYAGTSGHSGTDTSEERARRENTDGTTAGRQRHARHWVSASAGRGVTVKDLRDITGWHHGQASAALTNLHKAGLIARLSERRGRCKIYVLPEYVLDRTTEDVATRSAQRTLNAGHRAAIEDARRAYLASYDSRSNVVSRHHVANLTEIIQYLTGVHS